MAKRPTVYDVAAEAGVSIATVSFAFTQPHRVKSSTLDAVLDAADRLGYIPSASARGLAKGRTGALGLYAYDYLVDASFDVRGDNAPSSGDDGRLFPLYVDEVQRGVQLECWDRGLALMIGGARTTDHVRRVTDIAGRVDGLICFAGAVDLAVLESLSERIPVVELGSAVRSAQLRTVMVDNRTAMRELALHLTRHHGLRRIEYFGGAGTAEFTQRWDGFVEAMHDAGETHRAAWPSRPGYAATTRESLDEVLSAGQHPEAIVCSTDQEALVVLDRLHELGIRVPQDIAVTGFDGILATQTASPALTTARQPMEEIGRVAVRELLDALDGRQADHGEPLPTQVVIRRSCGCGPTD
ncbi:LacI family DNA-binding transcriptional regulator [Phytoactinopolyspora mesophila]|uniref:LacI family DNA-binding transcriptional regulator n=1 Tax=Phytoactinopolyspora mesophila TaxID=2650750 RepID=A0A7K3M830_9ACTN|nr:LacI family DNA-binding transcriptional regulator [Phytoactinopolyspora mesophila]NDL59435.1 LacI family DNA-binding transcriptional regulator [Phytoactinopolyspora mesophila]